MPRHRNIPRLIPLAALLFIAVSRNPAVAALRMSEKTEKCPKNERIRKLLTTALLLLFFITPAIASQSLRISIDKETHYPGEDIYVIISGPSNTYYITTISAPDGKEIFHEDGVTNLNGLSYLHLNGFTEPGVYTITIDPGGAILMKHFMVSDPFQITTTTTTATTTTRATAASCTTSTATTTSTYSITSPTTSTTPLYNGPAAIVVSVDFENDTIVEKPKIISDIMHFRAEETPEFEIEDTSASLIMAWIKTLSTFETLKAYIEDSSGDITDIKPLIQRTEKKYKIKIPRERKIKPGLYKLVVESESSKEEIWFTWGLVSVNTRKSVYRPDETAEILMVVLDKDGYLVSGADVSLVITPPSGDTSSYSTPAMIKETQRGIYQSFYHTREEGNYSLSVTAKAREVTSNIESYFSVRENYEFEITRETPSTIDPRRGFFESRIHVIPRINRSSFSLREYLPLDFEVVDSGNASVTTTKDAIILTWNLTNDSTVSYKAQAPLIWPYLYQLGPAWIDYDNKAFIEARPWYLAVDPTTGGTVSGGLRPQNITCYSEASTATCGGSYPSSCQGAGGTDYLSCNDGNQEAHTTKKGNFAGVEGTYYNSTTTNCVEITKTEVCYEWSSSNDNPSICEISIDNDGDDTWSAVSTSCPGSVGASGCVDVTNQEGGWTCSNFFGASGTRAALRSRQSSTANPPTTANWDQLWYNVTYVAAGYLNSTLNEPSTTETNNKTIYDVLTVNATIKCLGNTGDTCGVVNGTLRYNASSSEPDTQINTTTGAQPFYADLGNQTCGKLNATTGQDTCTLTWQVNTTQTGKWGIDVLFTSHVSIIDPNDTENAVIDVLNPPTLTVNLSAPLADPEVSEGENFKLNCTAECTGQDCVNVSFYAIYCSGSLTCTPNKLLNTTSAGLSADYDNISLGAISAGTQETSTFNISAKVYGDYVIACNATSNNAGEVTSLPTDLSLHVNDYPTAAFTYPSGGDLLSGIEKLNASSSGDTDGSITNHLFELDNNTDFDSPSTLCNGADENCTFNTTTQTECEEESMECYLRLTVTDDDGAQNYTIIQVGIDNTPPTISNEQINDTSISVNGWICLNVTAQDTLNVSTVIAEIDTPGIESNENLTLFDNGAGCDAVADDDVYSAEYPSTQSGTYNWTKTYVNDTAGNTNTSFPGATWDVTSDATMTVNMTEPAADLEINESGENNRYNQTCSVSCDSGGVDCENVVLYAQYNPGTWTDITQSTTDHLINDENNYSCGNLTAGGASCSHTFNITSGSSSGNNIWEIRCSASAHNAPESQSTAVNLTITDNSGPISLLDQPPTNGNITASEFTVNASVTDSGVGVISWVMFEYRTSPSASWQSACNDTDGTAPFSCVWNLSGLSDSTTYEVQVRANDTLGNLGGYDAHTGITVDRKEPSITLNSPINHLNTTNTTIAFNFTVTDNLAQILKCSLYINSALNQTNGSIQNDTPTTFIVHDISQGQHTWYINCFDKAGNSNVSGTRNYAVDYTHPSWSNLNQTINGQYTAVVHRCDAVKLSAYWTDNVRLSKAVLSTNETGIWVNKTSYGSPQDLTGASDLSNFTWSNASIAPGTRVGWRIHANDTTGNMNYTDVMSFTAWGWAKISSSYLNPSGIKHGESTTMNCRVQDNTTESPIEGYTVYFYNHSSLMGTNTTGSDGYATLTFTVNEAGIYPITCNITDNATLHYNVSSDNEGADTLGVGYGLSTYTYANTTYHRAYEGITNDTTTQIDDPYTDLESDNNIYQNFTAGSGSYAYTRFEMRVDEEINTVTEINITWMGFGDVGSGTDGYILYVYNTTNHSWMQVASYNIDNTEQTESMVYCIDAVNDTLNSSGYIKILARSYSSAPTTGAGGSRWAEIDTDYVRVMVYSDILSPTVTLNSPIDYSSSPVTFNCSVSDDYTVLNVTLYGDWSGGWHANETSTSGINNINYTFMKNIGDGVFRWNCRACDKAGNCDFAVLNRTLTVDSTLPRIQLQNPVSGSYTSDTTINFTFIVLDNMAEELNCSFYIDSQLKDTNESTRNNTPTVLTAASLSLGEHFWNITCRDKALNENSSVTWNFTIAEKRMVDITLINSTGVTIGNTQITIYDIFGQDISSKTITQSDNTLSDELAINHNYDIEIIVPLSEGVLTARIKNLNITENLTICPQVVENYTGEIPSSNVTTLFALNDTGLVYTLTELYIPKSGVNVTNILHCVQWNYSNAECSGWEVNDTGGYNMQENSTHIWFNVTGFDSFGGGQGKSLPNITEIRIYDVTGQASTHSGGSLVDSGLNTTFILYKREPRVYRVELDVRNDGKTQWTIDSTDIVYHEGLNSSWQINESGDIWYFEGTANYTGGNWSNGRVTWNTSQGGKLTNGETGTFYYVVNVTTSGDEKYSVYFLANDTVNNAGSYDNSVYNLTRVGYLEIQLVTPPVIPGQGDASQNGGYKVGQNKTFIVNATVYCRDGVCGDVNGTLRYNQSSAEPDTGINTSTDIPLYAVLGANTQTCPTNPLSKDGFCNLTWTVNSTGALNSIWALDVLFNSTYAEGNDTGNIFIEVTKVLIMSLSWSDLSFGFCDPNSVGNNASLNGVDGYNISVHNNSNKIDEVLIKGTDLAADSVSNLKGINYEIGVTNISWNDDENLFTGTNTTRLNLTYSLVREDINPGMIFSTYYWLDIPTGQYAQHYSGTLYVLANSSKT